MNDKPESCAESSYGRIVVAKAAHASVHTRESGCEMEQIEVGSRSVRDRLDAAFAARVIVDARQHAITLYLVVGGKYGRVPRVTREQIIAVVAKEMGFPPICTPASCTCTNARLKALHKKVREMTERLRDDSS